MSTLCLVMIVKNEAAAIRRCLDSVRPFIHHWVICDTGSTDDTKEIIRQTLKDVPGTLYEDPWVNFGHNRTLAIKRAKGKADYHLLMNADETLHCEVEFRDCLEQDAYYVRFNGPNDYWVVALVSDRLHWKYVGVTHEHIYAETDDKKRLLSPALMAERIRPQEPGVNQHLTPALSPPSALTPDPSPIGWARGTGVEQEMQTRSISSIKLQGVTLTHHFDGASRADKYERDVALLTKGLKEEPKNTRYMFYLAQTYRDGGYMAQALQWYTQRAAAGGWEEEVFYSL